MNPASSSRPARLSACALALVAVASALLLLAWPVPVQARPAGGVVDLVVGKEQIFRASVQGVAVDEEQIVEAEVLASRELLLTPRKPGRALLFLLGDSDLEVLRIRVRASGEPAPEVHASEEQLRAAARSCPGLKVEGSGEARELSATVSSPACREALLGVLATDDFAARRLALVFTQDTVKSQLEDLQAGLAERGLDAAFRISYAGLTLNIEGRGSASQKIELMRVLFDRSVGRVLLDDRSETLKPADAGTPAPPPAPSMPIVVPWPGTEPEPTPAEEPSPSGASSPTVVPPPTGTRHWP